MPSPLPHPHRVGVPRTLRAGVTLLELVVVLVVLGLVAGLTAPVFFGSAAPPETTETLVAAARASAIARAQALRLEVATSGAWRLWSPDRPGEAVARGQLPAALPDMIELELTPLGGCVSRTPAGRRDAARCTPAPGTPTS